ncbi:hypothetical protein F8388_024995 [Cannabis sativa]|uniref:Transposase MuDR plant domain-containing protein n=1 Tax=Cannabis sativa TaxID=3483 RepID=A0A7J6G3E8_CANSA|nr:hypothetical protein F8388_024995 [Cannabis sativa]
MRYSTENKSFVNQVKLKYQQKKLSDMFGDRDEEKKLKTLKQISDTHIYTRVEDVGDAVGSDEEEKRGRRGKYQKSEKGRSYHRLLTQEAPLRSTIDSANLPLLPPPSTPHNSITTFITATTLILNDHENIIPSKSVVVHATPNGPNVVGSTFLVGIKLESRMLYIVFNERWNAHNKYVDHEIKLLMVHKDMKFVDLVDKIHNLLNLNRNLVLINILFDVNMGTSKGMKIESDMDLGAYLIENNTKDDLRNCPFIVEVIEKNQTMAMSRTTSIAATTSASNATSRKKTAASSSAYISTNSISSRASGMAAEEGQEVQSPLTVLPSMGIEDLRVNHMFKNKEELKAALSRIAIKKNFQYKVKRSCLLTFWAKCIDENCEWYLRARSSKTSSYFRVIQYKNFHSCSLNHKSTNNRQANAKVISDCIKEKIRDPKNKLQTKTNNK